MKDKKCLSCKKVIKGHPNRKRCENCSSYIRKKPLGSMTEIQINEAKKLAGKMARKDIAKKIGVSESNLKRSCKNISFYFYNKHKRNLKKVHEILSFYEKNGKNKTQKKYPDIKIRSIIEHSDLYNYKLKPRQVKWSFEHGLLVIRMDGFCSKKQIAKYLDRPNAFEGSITSFWQKTFKSKKMMGTNLGLHLAPKYKFKKYAKKSCPTFSVSYKNNSFYLWHDLNQHLKDDTPGYIKKYCESISMFQEWIFQSKKPKEVILKMIDEVNTTKL